MALLDAAATTAQYLADAGQKATADAALPSQLTGMTRLLEKSLQVQPGAFNQHSATYTFSGNGTDRLWLRDDAGLRYYLRTITADSLKIDTDRDGTFNYLFDSADAWVRLSPDNAALQGEPYRWIDLRSITHAPIVRFPAGERNIEIAGTWGWATIPDIITQLVIHRTNELRQALAGGAAETLPGFDGGVPMAPKTFWLWKEAERLYGARLPSVGAR